MNKLEFLKEWYYKEEDRKDTLNNSINLQLGILTAILAAIFYLLTKYNYQNSVALSTIYLILQITTLVFWLISNYWLLKSYNNFYKGYTYYGFPNANFINEQYDIMIPYYQQHKDNLDKSVDDLVNDNIEKLLVKNIDNNFDLNDQKSSFLHKSKIHLVNCIIILFLSTIFFTINYIVNPQTEITNVKIINEMSKQVPPPPPPPPPQPREIKEHQIPKPTPPPPLKTK